MLSLQLDADDKGVLLKVHPMAVPRPRKKTTTDKPAVVPSSAKKAENKTAAKKRVATKTTRKAA